MTITLIYQNSISLMHREECGLLGVAPDLTMYVEAFYEDAAVRAILLPDGTLHTEPRHSHNGSAALTGRYTPPPDAKKPTSSSKATQPLNYTGARHRGLRELERISEAVRPISLPSKMALVDHLRLGVPPPHVLGVAESYVLSEAVIAPSVYVVCRRIRIAYALPQTHYDDEKQPYDYDTLTLHIAHLYDPITQDDEISIEQAFSGLDGIIPHHPVDCVMQSGHLFILEGGTPQTDATMHIWRIG